MRELGRERARALALRRPVADAAAGDVTAADNDIAVPVAERGEHLRQDRFVVLQVGIHHRDIGRGGGEDAFDAGTGEAAAADALDAAGAAVAVSDVAHRRGRAVRRIVVNEDHFPVEPGEDRVQAFEQRDDIVVLVEGRNDDRQFGCIHQILLRSERAPDRARRPRACPPAICAHASASVDKRRQA